MLVYRVKDELYWQIARQRYIASMVLNRAFRRLAGLQWPHNAPTGQA